MGAAGDEALGENQEAGAGRITIGGEADAIETTGCKGGLAQRPCRREAPAVEDGEAFPI